MNNALTVALNSLPNLATASPWDEVTIEKAKNFKDASTILDLGSHLDNLTATGKNPEDKIAKMVDVEFNWVSIPMSSYYNDLWFDLKKSEIPPLKSEIASGSNMLITPEDLVNILNVQKDKGYKFLVNAEASPVVVKHTKTLILQVRNYTVNM